MDSGNRNPLGLVRPTSRPLASVGHGELGIRVMPRGGRVLAVFELPQGKRATSTIDPSTARRIARAFDAAADAADPPDRPEPEPGPAEDLLEEALRAVVTDGVDG